MKKIFIQIFTIIFLIGAIIWMLTVISTTVLPSDNALKSIITSIFGLSRDFVARPTVVPKGDTSFEGWLYNGFLESFFTLATLIVIAGLFTVTKGRNIVEKYILLQAYALPRQRNHWGEIQDSKTRKGIAFAIIRLYKKTENNEKQFVTQSISDLDGRYRLNPNN